MSKDKTSKRHMNNSSEPNLRNMKKNKFLAIKKIVNQMIYQQTKKTYRLQKKHWKIKNHRRSYNLKIQRKYLRKYNFQRKKEQLFRSDLKFKDKNKFKRDAILTNKIKNITTE